MLTLRNGLTWFAVIALVSALIPGVATGLLARPRRWPVERIRNVARWLAVGLTFSWWVVAVYGIGMKYPYDWIGASIGTPVRILAFLAWCLSPGYFAPLIAERVSTLSNARIEPTHQPEL